VKARDEAEKKRRLESRIYPILYLMSGLIGFLPSGVKAKIEAKFGVSARNATSISIFIELLLFFLSGAILQISAFGAMYGFGVSGSARMFVTFIPVFIVLTLMLLVDVAMRYGSYLREETNPLGAFEWVWAWIWRRRKNLP